MLTAPPLDMKRLMTSDQTAVLDPCEDLQAPTGHTIAFQAYAEGVQIYRWNGSRWLLAAPRAVLLADIGVRAIVGMHYIGPTWQSFSGSKVVGRVLHSVTVDPDAIPWLLLKAVSTERPGVFQQVTFIQQVNTVGGKAPSAPGALLDEVVEVPYTAEYVFYQPSD